MASGAMGGGEARTSTGPSGNATPRSPPCAGAVASAWAPRTTAHPTPGLTPSRAPRPDDPPKTCATGRRGRRRASRVRPPGRVFRAPETRPAGAGAPSGPFSSGIPSRASGSRAPPDRQGRRQPATGAVGGEKAARRAARRKRAWGAPILGRADRAGMGSVRHQPPDNQLGLRVARLDRGHNPRALGSRERLRRAPNLGATARPATIKA